MSVFRAAIKAPGIPALPTALLLAALLPACDSTGPGEALVINGRVLDGQGAPVQSAPVGVIFDTGIYPNPGSISYRFSLEAQSECTLTVLDFRQRPVRTLLDHAMMIAGAHEARWNLRDDEGCLVPNNLYSARLEVRRQDFYDVLEYAEFLLNDPSDQYGVEVGACIRTDRRGRFVLPFYRLPIGENYNCGDEEGCIIPDSIWIQTRTASGGALVKIGLGDMSEGVDVTLRIE